MEKLPQWQTRIPAKENKSQYLELMEEMHERCARHARELDIRIKKMHVHMRDTELKQQEEELREHEEAFKKREEEVHARERELEERMKKSRNDY
jgi:hypothetical protein